MSGPVKLDPHIPISTVIVFGILNSKHISPQNLDIVTVIVLHILDRYTGLQSYCYHIFHKGEVCPISASVVLFYSATRSGSLIFLI